MLNKPLRVIVAGSRDFADYALLEQSLNEAKKDWSGYDQFIIVSGCARGADTLGERYAKEHGLEVHRYPANWDLYGQSAGYRRNLQMAANADALVAFRVGNSKGTTHMINIAWGNGLLVKVVEVP